MNLYRQMIAGRRVAPDARGDAVAQIAMVAIDLDGTLLNDDKKISQPNLKALRAIQAKGVKVVIASARPPRSVRPFYKQLGLDTWQINYNGAMIWDEPEQKVAFHRPLAGDLAFRMINLARSRFPSAVASCEVQDRWYTDREEQPYLTETGRIFRPDVITTLEDMCDRKITKLNILADRKSILEIEMLLSGAFGKRAAIIRADPELVQITHRRASKAAAMNVVAIHYGLALRQVMAIGDAPNDVGMLQSAGISVAMGNGHEIAKEVAHWTAPTNNEHGVRAALVKYGLYK